MPAQKAVRGLGFRDPGFPDAAIGFLQPLAGMIAFVADESAGLIRRRRKIDLGGLRAAASSVPGNVVVSPSSAGWIGAATMTPVSRSTACSGL